MKKKILITDKVHPLLVDELKSAGFEVNYEPKMTYQKIKAEIHVYNGIIINSKVKCDHKFLNTAQHLDFIGRLGSGLDIIDQLHASKLGIKIISSPEGNANAVSEHIIGMILSLFHHIGPAHSDLKNNKWNREPNRGKELKDMTVGIIGFGHTGPALAAKLQGFEVRILVYDKYRKDIQKDFSQVKEVPLSELLLQSDIVSIHLPLTDETIRFADKTFFQSMKKGAIVVNSSRGLILDSKALKNSLETKHLSGACLDVLENENPDTWTKEEKGIYGYLINNKKVIITPHIAGWTFESLRLIASILSNKIQNFYQEYSH